LERNPDAEIRYLGCNRERRIFVARRLAEKPMTLEELGEEFGVSRERVRQIERLREGEKSVQHRVGPSQTRGLSRCIGAIS